MNDASPASPSSLADAKELDALRALVEETASETGEKFLQSLVRNLAKSLGVSHAFVAEFAGSESRVRTLAYWAVDRIVDNVEYDLAGTPCREVLKGQLCQYRSGVARQFPDDAALADLGIESYLGVPLVAADGDRLGHLAVFDQRPMTDAARHVLLFRIFAARAAAEMSRLKMQRALEESEQRFRDLYDEAPIAYVQEGLDSKFINANRAAMRILGITPDQVAGTVGMSFVPDTPEAQRRVKEAFESVGSGADASGVVLELRRRDNGQPIWIEWWSKPDPSGQYTRTMFIDITQQVLMEQEKARLAAENVYLQEEIKSVHNFDEIVGQSPGLLAVLDQVRLVAATDSTVLIQGETGTGKELIARAIHSAGGRSDKPLIKLNCAALPSGLVESELFGHEKGAFTGALSRRLGRFELAHGGTIFLDEIGELPLEVQAKLLRVLQEREFERVGGGAAIKVDVRVIAATNRDLLQTAKDKHFREDLYYRLNVFPVRLPPLRERTEDIPMLVQFLVIKFAARVGRRIESVGRSTLDRLLAYSWPGNIRELENIIERAVILADGPTLEIAADALSVPEARHAGAAEAQSLEEIERQHILAVLRQTNWVIDGDRGAAKILNLHPNTLRSRLKKLGISRGD